MDLSNPLFNLYYQLSDGNLGDITAQQKLAALKHFQTLTANQPHVPTQNQLPKGVFWHMP
jgi:hypothetical protein